MSYLKIKTQPDLLLSSAKHKAAKINDPNFNAWQYNVADHLKGKTVEEIRQILKETANPFAICMEHIIGDFNMGTVIRNANAFNAKEVFYIGEKKWDKRAAVGVYNYTDVQWVPTLDQLIQLKDKYVFIGIDNVPGSVSISSYQFVPNSLFIFGEEGVGLTPEMQSLCIDIVEIPMYGSVRSLNCGTASGVVMHEFVSRFKKF